MYVWGPSFCEGPALARMHSPMRVPLCSVALRVQTTNLDGESNLKVRCSPSETKGILTDADMWRFRGVVKCGPPDDKIYTFDSQLQLGETAWVGVFRLTYPTTHPAPTAPARVQFTNL
jgi:hypothetical protein